MIDALKIFLLPTDVEDSMRKRIERAIAYELYECKLEDERMRELVKKFQDS